MDDDRGEYELPLLAINERLRMAREASGISLEQIAAETRIGRRHLEMIESGDFAGFPARTYALGFTRSYADMVGFNANEAVREVRAALDSMEDDPSRRPGRGFEPGDPARVPSATLGWATVLAALVVLAGTFVIYRSYFNPAQTLPSLAEAQQGQDAKTSSVQAGNARPAAGQEVVFTSLEDGVWVKFYDSDGRSLMQKQMAKGETYRVPPGIDGPQLWTGRPDALSITVGGRRVAPLAEGMEVMKDVPVDARALLARDKSG